MTLTVTDIKTYILELHYNLATTPIRHDLSIRDQSKLMKLQSLLLDVDSMLDDYIAPNPDFIDDPNDVASHHHY